jgi:pentatricopeptide repeat protein
MACYEVLIKLLSNAAHAILLDGAPSQRHCKTVQNRFVDKRPALGDWFHILDVSCQKLGKDGPPWIAANMRWLREETDKDAPISRLCHAIAAERQSLPTESPNKRYTALEGLRWIVNLRNAFGHGALTPRFAKRYNTLLAEALNVLVRSLRISDTWRFAVPLRYDPANPRKAFVRDPEDTDAASRSIPLGDRTTAPRWDLLHVGSSRDSFEDSVCLGPMIAYEADMGDYIFLNSYEPGEAEYLSYRSGRFDVGPAANDWREFFGTGVSAPTDDEPLETGITCETCGTPYSITCPKCGAVHSLVQAGPAPLPVVPSPGPPEVTAPTIVAPPPVLPIAEEAIPAAVLPAPVVQPPTIPPPGPSVRDLVAAFRELGARPYPPDWTSTLEEWERTLNPLSDELLTQLFAEMAKEAQTSNAADSLLQFLGNLQQRLGFHEDAVRQLGEWSLKMPDDKYRKSRHGLALLLWGTQLKADGKAAHDSTLIELGKDKLALAKKVLAESLHQEPKVPSEVWHNVRALSILVDACCRRGEFDKAAEYCDEGLKLDRDHPRLNSQRLFIHETLKR